MHLFIRLCDILCDVALLEFKCNVFACLCVRLNMFACLACELLCDVVCHGCFFHCLCVCVFVCFC